MSLLFLPRWVMTAALDVIRGGSTPSSSRIVVVPVSKDMFPSSARRAFSTSRNQFNTLYVLISAASSEVKRYPHAASQSASRLGGSACIGKDFDAWPEPAAEAKKSAPNARLPCKARALLRYIALYTPGAAWNLHRTCRVASGRWRLRSQRVWRKSSQQYYYSHRAGHRRSPKRHAAPQLYRLVCPMLARP